MTYERPVQILHLLLMLTVLIQLLSEQFMQIPKPGQQINEFGALIFGLHQFSGFIVLIVAIVYLMVVLDKAEGKNRLFPWLSSEGRTILLQEIKRDLPGWFKGLLPAPEQAHTIAGTVHGLGIVLATTLGVTGSMIYLGINPDGSMPPPIHMIKELHELLGILMWLFFFGHSAMALLHQLKGHQIIQAVFTRSGSDSD